MARQSADTLILVGKLGKSSRTRGSSAEANSAAERRPTNPPKIPWKKLVSEPAFEPKGRQSR
jgi:hypothetical protein